MVALRKWLLTGLLVVVPGVITAWVLHWIVSTLDQTLQILPVAWHPDRLIGFHVPGFGVVLTLLVSGVLQEYISPVVTLPVGAAVAYAWWRWGARITGQAQHR